MPKHVTPANAGLIAPNQKHEVQWTIDNNPQIDSMDEIARAEIIDITARRINPGHGEKPWGRKSRTGNANNPDLNTDAMCYLRMDGLFEIYDVISGVDGNATWDGGGPHQNDGSENGYWWPPNPVEDSGGGSGGGTTWEELETRVATLEQQAIGFEASLTELDTRLADLEARVNGLETAMGQPFHAHGPVNLPIVMESLTSLRCKGDIDVPLKPGTAEPPPDTSDDRTDWKTLIVLKRVLNNIRDDEQPPET